MADDPGGARRRRRVLLIAPHTSYRISAYYEAATRLGIELVVASRGEYSLVPEIASGINIDLESPSRVVDTVLDENKRRPFHAVIATDDATVELASHVAGALGLPHNPVAATRKARRKDLARGSLAAAGLPVPAFRRIDLSTGLRAQVLDLSYPCVVKPLALSASRGVIRVDNFDELNAACRRIAPLLSDLPDEEERRFLLVEAYLPGTEVALEGVLAAGQLRVLAIFDKPDPLEGPFFEETYYVTPSRLDDALQKAVTKAVEAGCRAYGLRQGPVHAELRIVGGTPHVLEIAARTIGGDCARLLAFGTGASLEEVVLRQAVGEPVRIEPRPGAAAVLMIPVPGAGVLRRVEGVIDAQKVPGIEDVVIAVREGYEITPLPEGGSYLGFIFARGGSPDEVEAALRRAHAKLKFVLAPAWRLEPGVVRSA
jgi:biotin carboxylase